MILLPLPQNLIGFSARLFQLLGVETHGLKKAGHKCMFGSV